MFSPLRVGLLLAIALLLTVTLYYLDTDPPGDDLLQRGAVFGMVLVLVTIVYAAGYGLLRELRRMRLSSGRRR